MTIHPTVAEGLGKLARIAVRAIGKAAESVLEDVGDIADEVSTKTKKARGGLGKIPRERRRTSDE